MTDYALEVTEAEIRRYRMMADRARTDERDLWRSAGIVPGAVVADVARTCRISAPSTDPRAMPVAVPVPSTTAARSSRSSTTSPAWSVRTEPSTVDIDGTAMRVLDVDPELADLDQRYAAPRCRRACAAPIRPTTFAPFFVAIGRRR
jgi:hypothetical protein